MTTHDQLTPDHRCPRILPPCQVDAILGKRGSGGEHEATLQVKTEFMQLWDGIESSRGQRVVVMGATNRPSEVLRQAAARAAHAERAARAVPR
jgi:SpoVK/Ycf46/Vps4 family AAA+-type ATPase